MGALDAQTAIIQVACGFARRPEHRRDIGALSLVDQARGQKVLELYRQGNQVFVTGNVPYETKHEFHTLAYLNAEMLIQGGVPFGQTATIQGLNAFSESWNACLRARRLGLARTVVVSSDFYFEAYERMWLAAARRNGLKVEIVALSHGDLVSPEVWNFYRGWKAQGLSRIAAYVPLIGHRAAKVVADTMTAKRATQGFKIDGHTVIS